MLEIDSSVSKLIGGVIAGGGSIYLTAEGFMPVEATIAILSSLAAFFVGEQYGKKNKV